MERGAFIRRDKSPLATILLIIVSNCSSNMICHVERTLILNFMLQCMFMPTLIEMCLDVEYLSENGICCNKCFPGNVWTNSQSGVKTVLCWFFPWLYFPGYRLAEECNAPLQRSNCTPCPRGQYIDTINYARNCRKCRACTSTVHWFLPHYIWFTCLLYSGWMPLLYLLLFFTFPTMPDNDVLVTQCQRDQNAVCRCKDGYYRFNIDSEAYQCLKCKRCDPNQKESQRCESDDERKSVKWSAAKQINFCLFSLKCYYHHLLCTGTPEKNTVCEDDYKNNKRCEPCSQCIHTFTWDSDGCTKWLDGEVSHLDETYSRPSFASLFPL